MIRRTLALSLLRRGPDSDSGTVHKEGVMTITPIATTGPAGSTAATAHRAADFFRRAGYWRGPDRLPGELVERLRLELDALAVPATVRCDVGLWGHGLAGTTRFTISPAAVAALSALAGRHHSTVFVVALALFHATLAAYTGTGDVLAGVVTANRRHPDHGPIIGFFANGRYLRTHTHPDTTVDDLIDQVAAGWTAGHAHQDLHLEKTVLDLGVPDLVNIKFGLDDTVDRLPTPDFGRGITITHRTNQPARSARRDLAVTLTPTADGGCRGHATYRLDTLTAHDAHTLTVAYQANLAHATRAPTVPLSHLEPHPRAER
jgi:hypothetical protein